MTRESRQYAWLRIAVLGTGAALLAVLSVTAVRLWPVIARAVIPAKLNCGCAVLAVQTPWWMTGLAALVMAGAWLAVGRFAWVFTRHLIRARRQEKILTAGGAQTVFNRSLGAPITVVESAEPLAVTLGFWRPKIYVSRGLLRRLSGSELRAVLAHEQAHQRAFDPLVTALMDSITATGRWLPGMSAGMTVTYSLRELAADAQATNDYRAPAALSSAFLKLSDVALRPELSAFSPNRDRLEKLLDHRWTLPRRWWSWTAFSAVSLVFIGALATLRYVRAANPVVPPAAATVCRETMVMCRAERRLDWPSSWTCAGGRCVTFVQPWTPTYVFVR